MIKHFGRKLVSTAFLAEHNELNGAKVYHSHSSYLQKEDNLDQLNPYITSSQHKEMCIILN